MSDKVKKNLEEIHPKIQEILNIMQGDLTKKILEVSEGLAAIGQSTNLMDIFIQESDSGFNPNLSSDLKQFQDIVFKMVRDLGVLEEEPNIFIKKCAMKRLKDNIQNLNMKISPYQICGEIIIYHSEDAKKPY